MKCDPGNAIHIRTDDPHFDMLLKRSEKTQRVGRNDQLAAGLLFRMAGPETDESIKRGSAVPLGTLKQRVAKR